MAENVNFCVWSVVLERTFSKKSFLQKPKELRRSLVGSHLTCFPSGMTTPEIDPSLPARRRAGAARGPFPTALSPMVPPQLVPRAGGSCSRGHGGRLQVFLFLRVCFARLGINKEKPSSGELGENCRRPPASLFPFPGGGVGFTLLNRSNNSHFKGHLRSRSDGAASR